MQKLDTVCELQLRPENLLFALVSDIILVCLVSEAGIFKHELLFYINNFFTKLKK